MSSLEALICMKTQRISLPYHQKLPQYIFVPLARRTRQVFQIMKSNESNENNGRVRGKTKASTGVGFSSECDRDMAMRQMRFQGHLRRPTPKSKGRQGRSKSGKPGLDTGWTHKKAEFYDEKLGLRRNEAIGKSDKLFDDRNIRYVDANRMVDGSSDDIKKVMSEAKRLAQRGGGGPRGGKSNESAMDRWADEEAFAESGGITGYIARAKNLIEKRKLYVEAIDYLDVCIKYGTKDFYITQKEDLEVLQARELRAVCNLNLAKYKDAEKEAEKILFWRPNNSKALHLYGEALYLQCKFERALMIFQRGFRLRTELYSKSFHNGIVKTTNVILSTIQTLNFCGQETNPKKIIPDALCRKMIVKSFFEDDFSTLAEKKNYKENSSRQSSDEDDLGLDSEKCPEPFGAAYLKKHWKHKEEKRKHSLENEKKRQVHFGSRKAMTKSSRDLRRLKEDESYLETLAHIFSHTGGKEKALFTKGGGYGKSSKKLEESGWDLSIPAPKRGTYDQQIANMASETVGFIQGRKHFWSLQTNMTTTAAMPQDLL